jgi:hypothetical protein
MVVKMIEVLGFIDVFEILKDKTLNLKTAYKINKIAEQASNEQKFYAEKFSEIVENYTLKDEDGNKIVSDDGVSLKLIPDKIDECSEKIQELHNIEITFSVDPLEISEIEKIDLTVTEFGKLMPFIKE